MCLLVSQTASTKFTDNFIKDVYRLNSDGLGVMYAEKSSLFINRVVPQTEKDFVDFFKDNIEGRDCAWHARMKTHGDIDLANCHPYQVLSSEEGYPLYLAHNGILATGNAKDKSKSDTWHFIQDYLRPMLLKNPTFFMTDAFADLIGEFIGSGNKFILMDAYGNQVVINEERGVEHEGAWLSNTYAWNTAGTKHDYSKSTKWRGNYNFTPSSALGYTPLGVNLNDDDEDEEAEYDAWFKDELKADNSTIEDTTKEVSDPNGYTESEEFCLTLFTTIEENNLVHKDLISWEDAATYFKMSGFEGAWDMIDAIGYGCYSQEELVDELTYFSKVCS